MGDQCRVCSNPMPDFNLSAPLGQPSEHLVAADACVVTDRQLGSNRGLPLIQGLRRERFPLSLRSPYPELGLDTFCLSQRGVAGFLTPAFDVECYAVPTP